MRFASQIRASATATQPNPMPNVAVIGGGAGGLVVAGRLARAGCRVTLLEKNAKVGGRMQSEYLDGWRFDTGPSLLLFPDKYYEAFEALGRPVPSCLDIRRIEPAAYRVFFPDTPEFRVDLLCDELAMKEQLEVLEKGAGAAFSRFLAMARKNLELGVPYFIDRDYTELGDAKGLMDLLPRMADVNPINLLAPHNFVMRSFFKDARLRAAFTFQDLYVGLSPQTAPAVFSLLAGTELSDGVWYPMGGFGSVVQALSAAASDCGVQIRTNEEVSRIEVNSLGQVVGIRLGSGYFVPADIVVCNRDLPAAYDLIGLADVETAGEEPQESISGSVTAYAKRMSEAVGRLQYSSGVIAYNWCIRGQLSQLLHHNVFLSGEFDKAWQPAADPGDFPCHANFYAHVPSRTDPSAAPEGCDSVMVLLPVANMQQYLKAKGVFHGYDDLITAGRQLILKTLRAAGVGDVGPLIEQELVIDPVEWERRYGLRHGAAFGLSHGLNQLSLFRPGNKESKVQGLYFVGASTRPGNGVPLCFIGAKLTANRILKDWEGAKKWY